PHLLPLSLHDALPISSTVFTGLNPGTYTFQVKDDNDCTYSESYTITPLTPITVIGQNITDIMCFGAADGSIQFTVSGSTTFNYRSEEHTSELQSRENL